MRMIANHYVSKAVPARAKKAPPAKIEHVAPPLMGLSLATNFTNTNSQKATILKNMVIEEDRISVRAGFKKKATRGTAPVWHLLPYYGPVSALAAASNGELWDAQTGNLIRGGFTGNDWHWNAYSNLGDKDYTIMVNGSDGVWSWDGAVTPQPALVTVTAVSKAAEAVVTVGAADISKFHNGDRVRILGATGAGWTVVNGVHNIKLVNTPANTFTLIGVDTSAATGTVGGTVQAELMVGIVKEPVTTNPADTFISVNAFHIVVAHQNRLFFADQSNLAIYYLPLFQKSGEVAYLPLNAVFKRGGYIKAMFTWTVEGGTNMNDQLVIFSSNGECAIYGGVDPDTDFTLSGLYRFDAPMSKHAITNYGGELYVLISTGLVPMSTLMKAETDKLGNSERDLVTVFLHDAILYRDSPGWMAMINPSTGRLFCNIPQGAANRYKQYVRHMPKEMWTEFQGMPAHCWGWIDPLVYFGDDSGNVYEMHPVHLNDDGQPITIDVQTSWSQYKTPADKRFLGIRAYTVTDGTPLPVLDIKVDYDYSPGINIPDITRLPSGAIWDTATWDVDYWAPGIRSVIFWNGVAGSGVVGAVRMTARIDNCKFSITGWDVLYEEGNFAL